MKSLKDKGFTLTELMIAIVLITLITSAVYTVYSRATNSMKNANTRIQDRNKAANASKTIERDLREIVNSSTFESISLANSDNIIFYSDFDNDESPEKIEYYLENQSIKRNITQPDSNNPPYTYNSNPLTSTLVENIVSSEIFNYYSEYESQLTSLPLSASDRQSVKLVKIIISIDSTGNDEPPPINLETNVNLRNQNAL